MQANDLDALCEDAEKRTAKYKQETDRSLLVNQEVDERQVNQNPLFRAGRSNRVWGELYKVVDSSDVIVQVIDARDPDGTRCKHIEEFLRKEKPHKHLILLMNKVDLVSDLNFFFNILSIVRKRLYLGANLGHKEMVASFVKRIANNCISCFYSTQFWQGLFDQYFASVR